MWPLIMCYVITAFSYGHAITIDTRLGKIEGVKQDIDGAGSIYKFLNIPFAKPPVGQRRFKKPEAYGSWPGILNATKYGPSCMQKLFKFPFPTLPNTDINEDCLSLNIFAPFDTNQTSSRSVMVWIFGGGFIFGQGMAYNPTNLALVGNVVVVTINYRVGPFGFFYTGDSNAPGNYALWDQKLALEWVNKNIEWFGGNKNSVTIFGESTGAYSVSLLSLNPQTKGLYQRVIAESGDATSGQTITEPSMCKTSYKKYAQKLGCVSEPFNSSAVVDCLRSLPADRLLTEQDAVLHYRPTIDGDFIKDYPLKLLQNTSSDTYTFFRSLDFISGINDADGSVFLSFILMPPPSGFSIEDGIPNKYFCNDILPKFVTELLPTYSNISNILCREYGDSSSLGAQGMKYIEMCRDVFMLVPSVQSLGVHSAGKSTGKTYQYLFAHTNELVKKFIRRFNWTTGACHGDELIFLFGMEDAAEKYGVNITSSDILLIHQMTKYWTNFAKTGDPNGDDLPVWPEYNHSGKKFLQIERSPSQNSSLFEDRVRFWKELKALKPWIDGIGSWASSIHYLSNSLFALIISLVVSRF